MKYKKLRIAWSVVSGLCCVLVIVLWVSSYRVGWIGSFWPAHWIASSHGELLIDVWHPSASLNSWEATAIGYKIPYWVLATLSGLSSVAFWLRLRFSLRSLLLATTAVALLLGIVFAMRG